MQIRSVVLFGALGIVGTFVGVEGVRAQAGRDACAADVEKFCKDVPVGAGRRYKCLKEHEKELSEACHKHVADVQSRVRGVREACWDDVSRFCQDAPRDPGHILSCLKAHESDLSDSCKAALKPAEPPPEK